MGRNSGATSRWGQGGLKTPGRSRQAASAAQRVQEAATQRLARGFSPGSQLKPGMCAGFKAGTGDAHHLLNETDEDVVYLELGDRTPGDAATYPDDDIAAAVVDGAWRFTHKDGAPYG